ncbi:hypothetical protein PENTCL1PPCAC_2625 [Pristionchus entomophagus]|uniref:Partial AB-hydrolase lipase domain-containing protein n=1 Tax=Pristionchus entomophagus TaxID=358040 RepID=A0AAV5SC48_9BILA|nr:hypothetical protein PENTCL1PPCAC_2625 [Pristionchus entomophagus]
MRQLLLLLLTASVSSAAEVLVDDVPLPVDPEALMSVPEIILHWGYPVESHNVVTADGYVLTLHRIPHGRNETAESARNTSRPVVFLQHGLMCSSSMWVLNLPHQSAGFVFADAGYDVWMGNSRGNIYSRRHLRMTEESDNFWRFTWQQMAEHDLPASIDGVLKATNQSYVYYVGHSQGALSMFAKQAVDPAFAPKIRQLFALAPVARLAHTQGAFTYLGKMYDQAKGLLALFGDGQFLRNNLLTRILADLLCDSTLSNPLCTNLIFSISGPDSHQFNNTRVPIYLAHNPAGTSIRNMVHFAQMVHNKRFAPYDLGKDVNMKLYGAPFAPEYDVSQVASPTYLFYSDADWLASPEDVEGFLMRRLNSTVLRVATRLTDFNHNDFMWGLRARKEIYDPIDNIIRQDVRRQEIRYVLSAKDGKASQSIKVLYNKKSQSKNRRMKRIIVKKVVHSSINSQSAASLERAKMKRDEEKS